MKKHIAIAILTLVAIHSAFAQTKIAKEQIEDAFILKTGGSVYGDVLAATSMLRASTFALESDGGMFQLFKTGSGSVIRSNLDLYLDPTAGGTASAKIVPVTVMEFPDYLGDKVRYYGESYKIGVSPYDLDITSDRNVKFHSDTVDDLMVVWGDEGDVSVKRDLQTGRDVIAGGVFKFVTDGEGDKIRLYGTLYRLAISANTLDFYSDNLFEWHTDSVTNAMQLDGDTGRLTLSGPLKLPIYTSLPTGETGDAVYLDHQSDDGLDGLYIRCATSWQQCN